MAKETEKLRLYNKKETEIIISYYKPKIINKIFGNSIKLSVLDIMSEKYKSDKYRVNVVGFLTSQSHTDFIQDIKSFSKENDLISPDDLLNNQD